MKSQKEINKKFEKYINSNNFSWSRKSKYRNQNVYTKKRTEKRQEFSICIIELSRLKFPFSK